MGVLIGWLNESIVAEFVVVVAYVVVEVFSVVQLGLVVAVCRNFAVKDFDSLAFALNKNVRYNTLRKVQFFHAKGSSSKLWEEFT